MLVILFSENDLFYVVTMLNKNALFLALLLYMMPAHASEEDLHKTVKELRQHIEIVTTRLQQVED